MEQVGTIYAKIDEIDDDIKYFDKNMDSMDEKTSQKLLQNIGKNLGELFEKTVKNKPFFGVSQGVNGMLLGVDNNGETIPVIYNTITDKLHKNTSNLSKMTFKYKGKDIGSFYK
jgi:hypothetical protein